MVGLGPTLHSGSQVGWGLPHQTIDEPVEVYLGFSVDSVGFGSASRSEV
jgi:hypothetical protein